MHRHRFPRSLARMLATGLVIYLVFVALVFIGQRSLLYFPSHRSQTRTKLQPWSHSGEIIGFCREAPNAHCVWLMTHGNEGQAADRDYVLNCLPHDASLYVLEYPGYGLRPGKPSLESFNQAAIQAYNFLRKDHPDSRVCVLGESIGSGAASVLAGQPTPPDKIVLVVPFDTLASVAGERFYFLPARLLLRDGWDNTKALKHYSGPVEIFAAEADSIIPIEHAKALAKEVSQAKFSLISGGHNEWSDNLPGPLMCPEASSAKNATPRYVP